MKRRWPVAEFIVGNPPFMGQFRQREAFGDGYVDALRAAYPAGAGHGGFRRCTGGTKLPRKSPRGARSAAGLITTQSITQRQNRQVVVDAEAKGARVAWAIPDHYWNDGSDDARVRVAMTVIVKDPPAATLVTVDGEANVVGTVVVPQAERGPLGARGRTGDGGDPADRQRGSALEWLQAPR